MSATDWIELAVNGLPTGTVTLLLADIEGSTRLWETQSDVMTDTVARLDKVLADACMQHHGVRPVEQGEGDSFVIAFARASDAVACALDLQRAQLAPIKLRIGVHTGEVQLRDEGNYVGPTINRTARLRDLGHGGQTLLSGATELLVVDQLPPDVSLNDLGTHPLRDLPRPERVIQLCQTDLPNDFPPLRSSTAPDRHNLPVQLTNFVGRQSETTSIREALNDTRLVTLTGTGGAGKTRLATHVAERLAAEFADGVCYVDLAPITVPDVVPVTAAKALGLPDQPGRSTMETLGRYVRDRHMLVVLDNCEHLLDSSAALVVALLGAAAKLTVLATSREPLGVTGEATWQVPSLSLADEAIELFADRARLAKADFTVTVDNAAAVDEICRRLDGMPLAIELAAARVRALTLTEIVDSLHDRFRLLTGGSRVAVRRQQTLRASVDWSHALLTETERILFRRLAVFLGGFDLDAAQFVGGGPEVERYQVLDQLTLLVDKSLVVADDTGRRTRYRLLETVRQYTLEKLGESGEADAVRSRHRDHYTSMAAVLDAPAGGDYERRLEQVEAEMDNLRSAFGWSLENADAQQALALASSLQPLWISRGRMREGQAWIDIALGDVALDAKPDATEVAAGVRARALADKSVLDCWTGTATDTCNEQAQSALAMAREIDDDVLLARTLSACGFMAGQRYDGSAADAYFTEAIGLARASHDRWTLSQILSWRANAALVTGDPTGAHAAGEEGLQVAAAIGDWPNSRVCRASLGYAALMRGEVDSAVAQFRALVAESEAARDSLNKVVGLLGLGNALGYQGQAKEARATGVATLEAGADIDEFFSAFGHIVLAQAALVDGDVDAAREANDAAWPYLKLKPDAASAQRAFDAPVIALATGELGEARRLADEAVAVATGWHLAQALMVRSRVGFADGSRDEAQRDARDALACVADCGAYLAVPDALESLAALVADVGNYDEAARLFGAADGCRRRMGAVRYKVYDASYETSTSALRDAVNDKDLDAAWAEGAGMSTEEAVAYTQRGRGERKRPASGWASLTPAELDVVRLVSEGLTNKDVATRMFISPRTVQSHLAHVFAKLGVSTRTQLAQEATRNAASDA